MKVRKGDDTKQFGIPSPPTKAYMIITLATKLADKQVRLSGKR